MAKNNSPADFKPAWWLRNRHLQTLWPTLVRKSPLLHTEEERLELDDGDFLDLSWSGSQLTDSPIVILFHGLEGSLRSNYIRGLMAALPKYGMRGLLMHFRGCSGRPNRLARSYHSGETEDMATVVRWLVEREPQTPIGAVGYSLGGNALLKWLGETGSANPLNGAVAVSVPFELNRAALQLERGFSRIYQNHLLKQLRNSVRKKFDSLPSPVDLSNLASLKTFRHFDDRITAPLHGFQGVDDYYEKSSSRSYLKNIEVPTLILHSKDDPFLTPQAIPTARELSPAITLELAEAGGHVGFVSGTLPWQANYWLEEKIPLALRGIFDL